MVSAGHLQHPVGPGGDRLHRRCRAVHRLLLAERDVSARSASRRARSLSSPGAVPACSPCTASATAWHSTAPAKGRASSRSTRPPPWRRGASRTRATRPGTRLPARRPRKAGSEMRQAKPAVPSRRLPRRHLLIRGAASSGSRESTAARARRDGRAEPTVRGRPTRTVGTGRRRALRRSTQRHEPRHVAGRSTERAAHGATRHRIVPPRPAPATTQAESGRTLGLANRARCGTSGARCARRGIVAQR